MPDDQVNAVEQEARQLGWVPKEEFQGDGTHWIDAADFVQRGKTILPILRKNNERLHSDVTRLGGEVSRLTQALTESQDAIKALVEHQTEETKRHVERARKEVLSQLRQARRDQDVEAEVQLKTELDELDAVKRKAETPPPAPAKQPVRNTPAFDAWLSRNPWFNQDLRKTSLATAIATEWTQAGRRSQMSEEAFYNAVTVEMERSLGGRQNNKVESGGASGGSNGRAYSDLPAEAKAACDNPSTIARLVGPNKAFKDVGAWRTHYVSKYFEGERS
jgi:hypothetical protein